MLTTDPVSFWAIHVRECGPIFSSDFRDLFMKMVAVNPTMRPSIDEILSHPWALGTVPMKTDVKREFIHRKALLAQQIQEKAL